MLLKSFNPAEAWGQEIAIERAMIDDEAQARQLKAQERIQGRVNGSKSIIERFNREHPVEILLEKYGHKKIGKKWLSPNSGSGVAGIVVKDGHWFDHHECDSEIGQPAENGGTWGDGFDLFVYYEHDGDEVKARNALVLDMFELAPEDPADSQTWENPVDLPTKMKTDPAPIPWFIHNRIVAGRGLLVTGTGGSSKTKLLYHLAAGAALGRLPWAWDVCSTGRSVLVLTEDTADDVHRTVSSLSRALGLSPEDQQTLYRSLIIFPMAGKDIILLSKTKNGTLEKSKRFLELTQKIKDLGDVVLVGMDPALSLTDGDELDQSNQRALGKMADDLAVLTGATVALVTHATKGSLNQDTLGSHSSRGGGAITDAARTEFVMRTMTQKEFIKAGLEDPEEQFRHVQLVGTKGNYLPPSAYLPVWLRRDDFGMLSGSDISFEKKAGPTEKDISALSLLRNVPENLNTSIKPWRNSCIEHGLIQGKTEDATTKAMQRIIKTLKASGMIRAGAGRGVWLPVLGADSESYEDF